MLRNMGLHGHQIYGDVKRVVYAWDMCGLEGIFLVVRVWPLEKQVVTGTIFKTHQTVSMIIVMEAHGKVIQTTKISSGSVIRGECAIQCRAKLSSRINTRLFMPRVIAIEP